jgi:hypothetical protein
VLEDFALRLLASSQTLPEDVAQLHNIQDTLQITDNTFRVGVAIISEGSTHKSRREK